MKELFSKMKHPPQYITKQKDFGIRVVQTLCYICILKPLYVLLLALFTAVFATFCVLSIVGMGMGLALVSVVFLPTQLFQCLKGE